MERTVVARRDAATRLGTDSRAPGSVAALVEREGQLPPVLPGGFEGVAGARAGAERRRAGVLSERLEDLRHVEFHVRKAWIVVEGLSACARDFTNCGQRPIRTVAREDRATAQPWLREARPAAQIRTLHDLHLAARIVLRERRSKRIADGLQRRPRKGWRGRGAVVFLRDDAHRRGSGQLPKDRPCTAI